MKKIIILIIYISQFSIYGYGQTSTYNCSDSVLLNTGYNHNTNTLHPFGSIDPNWQVVQMPVVTGTTCPTVTLPSVSYVVNDLTSTILTNSHSISFQATNALTCNNASAENPIVFEKQFCIKSQDVVTVSGIAHYDDMLCVFVDNVYVPITIARYIPSGTTTFSSNLLLNTATSCDAFDPNTNVNRFYGNRFSLTIPLSAGVHNVQLRLRNLGGKLCSVKMEGSIKSATGKTNNFECPDVCKNSILSIKKHIDVNCDGILNLGDTTARGWTFVATLPDGTSKTITTDDYGYAYINNLPASGVVNFVELIKPGYNLTFVNGALTSGTNTFQLILNNSGLYEVKLLNSKCNNSSPCQCGSWGAIGYSISGVSNRFLCATNGPSTILNANQGDMFSLMPTYTCSGATAAQACNAVITYDIYFPKGGVLLGVNNINNRKLDSCGDIRVVMRATCNGKVCDSCEFIVRVKCCNCVQDIKPTLYWQNANSQDSLKLNCGETKTNILDCFKEYTIKVKSPCGTECAPDSIETAILYTGMSNPSISYSLVGVPISVGTMVGNYEVTIRVKCNGVWCAPCRIILKQTKSCPPPCNNCKDKVQATFNSSASSVVVAAHTAPVPPNASTINASFLLGGGTDTYTEVRANIVDMQLSSGQYVNDVFVPGSKECLQCYNTANSWGSLIAGVLPGFTSTVTTYPGVGATNTNNNPREIVFGASTPTTIPASTPLNLTIKIPAISTISCCCINVKVFVKITYRNNKCEECSKVVLIDVTQCPGGQNVPKGEAGSASFYTGGKTQLRISSPTNGTTAPVSFDKN
jgi:hypothetical protein